MLNLKDKHFKFNTKDKIFLKRIDLKKGTSWGIASKDMLELKERITKYLKLSQDFRCAYCSSRLDVGGRPEIEHIAPKGKVLYPEFTFNGMNLVLACSNCNGSSKKGQIDPISKRSIYYKRCQFLIVHPYFDDPDQHYLWLSGVKICISARNQSLKALNSIDIFKLDSPFLTEQRAMEVQKIRRKERVPLSPEEEDQIDRAINFLP